MKRPLSSAVWLFGGVSLVLVSCGGGGGDGDGGGGGPGDGNPAGGGSGGSAAGSGGAGGHFEPDRGARAYFESGERLRAVVERGDGAPRFVEFFDRELDEPCAFESTDASTFRCIPNRSASAVAYSDPSCTSLTHLIAGSGECGGSARFATEYDATGTSETCSMRYHILGVYRVGDVDSERSQVFQRTYSGECEPVEIDPTYQELRKLGEKIPLENFVRGREERVQLSDELEQGWIVGEDGSSLARWQFWDTARASECLTIEIEREEAGEGKTCIPRGYLDWSTHAPFYSDSGCSTRVVAERNACESSDVILMHSQDTPEPGTCGGWRGVSSLRWRGAELSTFYEGDSCEARDADEQGTRVFEVGPPASPAEFPYIEESIVGSGRLRVRSLAVNGGLLGGGAQFWDEERGAICHPYLFSDGKTYCLPEGTGGDEALVFADAECEEPLLITSECHPRDVILRYSSDTSLCRLPEDLSPLLLLRGERLERTTFFALTTEGCVEHEAQGEVLYTVRGPVPVGEHFVEVTRERE